MKFGLKESVIERINAVFMQYPNVERVIVYGSRAKGNFKNGSDIDLTMEGPELTLSQKYRMEEQIEDLLLPYMVDLSIKKHLENSDLLEHIARVGQVFYQKRMEFDAIKKIYFIGIGGIGMSALARYFRLHGAEVHGYDRTTTELTRALEAEGMRVHYDDDVAMIPEGVDLVVFTPAVPKDHAELNWFLQRGYPVKKRAEVLGIISRAKRCVAIAGTHGKTTTSTMTAHLLRACGVDATAFVGGISGNLGSNFVEGQSDWVVVEADEYDRSFLHLSPEIAVVNSIDPDHLDIYGSAEEVRRSYAQFCGQVKPDGTLLLEQNVDIQRDDALRFGIETGHFAAKNIRVENGDTIFDLEANLKNASFIIHHLALKYPGLHNVRNATAAIAATLLAGGDASKVPAALADFRGVKRRFETIAKTDRVVYVDDYAHHPAELEAAIGAARMLYPGRRLTGIFQPHLYTRTRDFAAGFAAALDLLDECILLDIYPAREHPIPGVDSAMIAGLMKNKNVTLTTKENLLNLLKTKALDVLMTMGAGDVDTFVEPIKQLVVSYEL
jgi:UDP-N-acetylmuramate--alanine ligase